MHRFDGMTGKSNLAKLIQEMGDNAINIIMATSEFNNINILKGVCCLFTNETPCHLAAKQGNHRLLGYLIYLKAYDKYARDADNKTVLDVYVRPSTNNHFDLALYNLNVENM